MCTTCPPSHPYPYYPLDWCAGACCVGPTNCSSPCGCRSACMCGSAFAPQAARLLQSLWHRPPLRLRAWHRATPAPPACSTAEWKVFRSLQDYHRKGSHATCTVGEYVNAPITFNSARADWFPKCGPKGTFSYQATFGSMHVLLHLEPCSHMESHHMRCTRMKAYVLTAAIQASIRTVVIIPPVQRLELQALA
jgi:hypothetical protein